MAKNEFFVNSVESSRLIYDFVLKFMAEAGMEMPLFPRSFFMRRSPNRNFTAFMAGRYGADALGRFSFRMRMCLHSHLHCRAREERFLLRRVFRGCACAACLVLCAHFLAEDRGPERGEPKVSFVPESLSRLVPSDQKLLPAEEGLRFLPLPELQGGRARAARQGKDPHYVSAMRLRL